MFGAWVCVTIEIAYLITGLQKTAGITLKKGCQNDVSYKPEYVHVVSYYLMRCCYA